MSESRKRTMEFMYDRNYIPSKIHDIHKSEIYLYVEFDSALRREFNANVEHSFGARTFDSIFVTAFYQKNFLGCSTLPSVVLPSLLHEFPWLLFRQIKGKLDRKFRGWRSLARIHRWRKTFIDNDRERSIINYFLVPCVRRAKIFRNQVRRWYIN